ncbi:MAG: bifunctional transaldolase/phosoglucose isomerase [Caldilineaceae bacterium]|nr:bifunctional transaldolase/phosoglucose isomerase [Caldilineaceae bacterium]
MTILNEIAKQGQSIWLDYIRRAFLDSGEMNVLVEKGLRGVTSNPSIFQKAITSSTDYDAAIERLVDEGAGVNDIYEHVAIQDIRRCADILRPVYERTRGADGFVSLEVNPKLAYDTEGTIMEARRLSSLVDRPNLMIKVPATPQGIPAIETLIGEGININVTLMFSMEHYEATADAYIRGLEKLAVANIDPGRVSSVASFFISRVDGVVDEKLAALGNSELQGKIAIANAKLVYARFQEIFSGPRWDRLAANGARVQRPLWGSTSTKNPSYPDTLYVDELIGPHTVNTLPPATLDAVLAHGNAARTVDQNVDAARAQIEKLAELGIDLDKITAQLQEKGVAAFAADFDVLMQSIADKAAKFAGGRHNSLGDHVTYHLGDAQGMVEAALAEMDEEQIVTRIWAHSHTVWSDDPEEIINRLGWLRIAETMRKDKSCIEALGQDLHKEGYTHAVVLGMGGSSLAPEVFGKLFHSSIKLSVLDSTHPDALLALAKDLDLARTIFLVSTKSGTTTETLSFFKYFYNLLLDQVGKEKVGDHFIAITDPGSKLVKLAKDYKFRAAYLNDPNIGGRYSALSYFGLIPACLVGVDLTRLLRRSLEAMNNCGPHLSATQNPGATVGAILGEMAKAGRDKLTVIASPQTAPFADWLEQLLAESTGKIGKGIVPVVGEAVGSPDVYGSDRLFVYLRLSDEDSHRAAVDALIAAGQPVIETQLRDVYDLGSHFFLWEFATAVAGARMGIHPFDQPDVESAKVQARKMMTQYMDTGKLPEVEIALQEGELSVAGDVQAKSIAAALGEFLAEGDAGDYISLQAYIQPSKAAEKALRTLQTQLRDHTRLATTLGFGPRFLHSTGQLHKGDRGNGLFIQFVDKPAAEAPIPDEAGKEHSSVPFSVLIDSQSLGDRQALLDAGRRVLRIDLGRQPVQQLKALTEAVIPVKQA